MPVMPEDIYDLFEELVSNYHEEEAARRCAISRGYYYAFLYTREKWRTNPISNFGDKNKRKDHDFAKEFFRDIDRYELANKLNSLRKRRRTADYKLSESVNLEKLIEFEEVLDKFIEEAEKIPESIEPS